MKRLAYLLAALLCTGCISGTREIGRVGDTTYHVVRHQSFSGPNVSLIVSQRDCEDTPQIVTGASGSGIGNAVVGGGAVVGGAALFGGAIRPSKISVSSGASASSAASGTGTSSSFVPPGHINNPSHNH